MRKFRWWWVLVAAVCFALPYFLNLMTVNSGYDNPLLLLGGLNNAVLLLALFSSLARVDRENFWKEILSHMGVLCMVLSMLTSLPLTMAFILPGKISIPPEGLGEINFFTLSYLIFCIVFVWNSALVKEDTAVVLNGRLYYPGERYFCSLFFSNEIRLIDGMKSYSLELKSDFKELEGTDFTVKVDVWVWPYFWEARRANVRELDYDKFIKEIREFVGYMVAGIADGKTVGEFLREISKETRSLEAFGFPLIFYGNKTNVHFLGDF